MHTLVNMGSVLFCCNYCIGSKKNSCQVQTIPVNDYDTFHQFSWPTGSCLYGVPGPWCVRMSFSDKESSIAVSIILTHTHIHKTHS